MICRHFVTAKEADYLSSFMVTQFYKEWEEVTYLGLQEALGANSGPRWGCVSVGAEGQRDKLVYSNGPSSRYAKIQKP